MSRLLTVILGLSLSLPIAARATTGGPNSFQVLGVDSKASKLLLKESVGGESGDYRLWTFDLKVPAAAPTITPFTTAPAGLEQASRLATNDVKLAGQIAAQSLAAFEDALLHKFDLKVELNWNGARATVDVVAYRTATVRMVDALLLPGNRCAVAVITSMGKPEEGGYELHKPVLLCADKAINPGARLEGPAKTLPKSPRRFP